MIEEGTHAPDFELTTDGGETVSLESLRGKPVVLGKTYMGVERSTFVIDPDGTIAKVMRRVKPDTHADDVLAVLR